MLLHRLVVVIVLCQVTFLVGVVIVLVEILVVVEEIGFVVEIGGHQVAIGLGLPVLDCRIEEVDKRACFVAVLRPLLLDDVFRLLSVVSLPLLVPPFRVLLVVSSP